MEHGEQIEHDGKDYSVRAVERTCNILDLLQERSGGVSLGELAGAVDLPKSSAFRYMWTLERRRYVRRDPVSDEYQLGAALLPVRSRQLEMLTMLARPYLEALRDRFEETVNLGYLEGQRVVYLDVVESNRAVRLAARPGDRDPIHSTALGKVIAAQIPEKVTRSILRAEGMPAFTPSTITDVESYLTVLAGVRVSGYGLDDGENESDGRCVAVRLGDDRFLAGLSLSAPSARLPMHSLDSVVKALHETAELLLGEMGSAASTASLEST